MPDPHEGRRRPPRSALRVRLSRFRLGCDALHGARRPRPPSVARREEARPACGGVACVVLASRPPGRRAPPEIGLAGRRPRDPRVRSARYPVRLGSSRYRHRGALGSPVRAAGGGHGDVRRSGRRAGSSSRRPRRRPGVDLLIPRLDRRAAGATRRRRGRRSLARGRDTRATSSPTCTSASSSPMPTSTRWSTSVRSRSGGSSASRRSRREHPARTTARMTRLAPLPPLRVHPARSMTVASLTSRRGVGMPLVALADWSQFQEGPRTTVSPTAPRCPSGGLEQLEIDLERRDVTGGLSSPVVGEDGTIVVVAPNEVLGSTATTGRRSSQRIATSDPRLSRRSARAPKARSWCSRKASATAARLRRHRRPPPRPRLPRPLSAGAAGDEEFDSHVNAIDLRPASSRGHHPSSSTTSCRTPSRRMTPRAYVGDLGGQVTAVELSTGEVRWTEDLGTPIAGAVTLDADRALVTTVGEQRDAGGRGRPRRRHRGRAVAERGRRLRGNLVSTPVVADGRVLILELGVRHRPRRRGWTAPLADGGREPDGRHPSSRKASLRWRRSRPTAWCSPWT